MENISVNKDQQFMCRAIFDDGSYQDEYYINEDGEMKENLITEIIDKPGIKQFGIVGEEQFLNVDTDTHIFEILKNKIKMSLIDENGVDVFGTDRINKFICFITNHQTLSRGALVDMPVRYTFGYKINNDLISSRIMIAVDKYNGVITTTEITPNKDFKATFKIEANDKPFANAEMNFIKQKKFTVNELKIF
jgi:hypothetical protein